MKRTTLFLILFLAATCLCANAQRVPNKKIKVGSYTFTMIYVEGGTFQMGSDSYKRERPRHTVTVDDFYIGETEVTQALWVAVMGKNPSLDEDLNKPVHWVSYNDCIKFIEKLKEITQLSFRLPTEAEWEYAARGGNKSKGYKYSGSKTLGNIGWYRDNADQVSHDVRKKMPNELGIYDMSGNVWEWCQDWFDSEYYTYSPSDNPQGPDVGNERVVRGGAWGVDADFCRNSYRAYVEPDNDEVVNLGFRLVLVT